jgi:hypothetical protein
VTLPEVGNVTADGAAASHVHPVELLVRVIQYGRLASAVSSAIVKVLIATVRLEAVGGITNAVTVGGVVSGRVIFTVWLVLAEIFPAASLAQA